MSIENFKFFKPLELRWNDLDPIGHVNNVFYFEYFQIGRAYYMLDVSKQWDWTKHMFVIAHIECDYQKELTVIAINPKVGLRITKFGTKSFEFEYIITSTNRKGENIIHAIGKSTQVMIDMQQGKSIELPEWLVEDFKLYEPKI